MKFDVIIIGAGASGLTAAYQISKFQPQLNILVLEKETYPGRKLNATGNGKCNLTNAAFSFDCYYSKNAEQLQQWVKHNSYKDMLSFFESIGILLYEKNGYYYPKSNQARQVTNLLYEKSKLAGVVFHFGTKATDITPLSEDGREGYQINAKSSEGKNITYQTSYVMIATGGSASPKLGGCKDGYKIAKKLGLRQTNIYPVLSPVYVTDSNISVAKGVRLDVNVSLKLPNGEFVKEAGQVQFNDNNLSGIVIMNLSCLLNQFNEKQREDCIYLDVLPDYTWDYLKQFFLNQKEKCPSDTLEMLLNGILPHSFGKYLMKRLAIDGKICLEQVSEKQINRLTSNLKKLTFSALVTDDYEKAQVTGGGIALEEINIQTFSTLKYPNMYITGEILDVYGKCGGYNLTFAVLSGISAAKDIHFRIEQQKQ